MNIKDILFVGAHPDDIEIGCGGLILKLLKYSFTHVTFLVMTGGDYTKGDSNEIRETRQKEQESVVNYLNHNNGIEYLQCHLSDNKLNDELKCMIEIIERIVIKNGSSTIFTHSKNDTHHDHRTVYEASLEASRKHINNIFSYEEIISNNFNPNCFLDIADYIEGKIDLIHFHKSQKDKISLNPESIKALARHRAAQFNQSSGYYEAFEIIKMGEIF